MSPEARETEERILEAASAVFQRKGTAAARVQEIADEAGVNKALVHYYFRSKEKLAQAVYRRAARQLMPALLALGAVDVPLEEKVERVIGLVVGALIDHPLLAPYLLGELSQGPARVRDFVEGLYGVSLTEIRSSVFGGLEAQIAARVREGTMRPISAQDFGMNLMSLCVYPFVNRPALMLTLGLDEAGFAELMRRRGAELPGFFLAGLRP